MDPIVSFFRAYPRGQRTLCSEAIVSWLRARGVAVDLPPSEQLALWRDMGSIEGAAEALRRLGASIVPPADVEPGDIVALRQDDGSELLGLRAGEVCVAAAFGRLLIESEPDIVAAWRI